MAQIFVSYAREDQAAARRIVDALQREGLDAWWDHELPPGRSWDEVIGERVRAARAVIVIWSKQSVGSNFVKEEAQLAQDAGKFVPVKIDEVEPPIGFRRTHAANLVGWRGESEHRQWMALLREIRDRIGAPTPPRRDPPPASAPRQATPPQAGEPPMPKNVRQALIAILVVAVLGVVLFAMQGERRDRTQQTAPAQTAATQPQLVPPPLPGENVELAGTTWSGVLTIGVSQHPLEFRFRDNGELMIISRPAFEQDWVWRYNGDGFEITGHQQRFTGAVRGEVMSGEYDGARGSGAFQLVHQPDVLP
jgi:hypothetical protein